MPEIKPRTAQTPMVHVYEACPCGCGAVKLSERALTCAGCKRVLVSSKNRQGFPGGVTFRPTRALRKSA